MTSPAESSVEVPRLAQREVVALAALVHKLRPDWDEPGIAAALRQHAELHLGDVMIAWAKGAVDPTNETPAAVLCFNNRAWEDQAWPPCAKHGKTPRRVDGECGSCHADRTADDNSAPRFTRPEPPAGAVAAIRQALHRGAAPA